MLSTSKSGGEKAMLSTSKRGGAKMVLSTSVVKRGRIREKVVLQGGGGR